MKQNMKEKIENLIKESETHKFSDNCYSADNGTYGRAGIKLQAWVAEVEDFLLCNYGYNSSAWKVFERFNLDRIEGNLEDSFEKQKGFVVAALVSCLRIEPKLVFESTSIFIGHGRSPLWRELKDFIVDRLELPYEEFNRVPVAGQTNIIRLSRMLEASRFAFLIMTAEDEQNDGKFNARMNVIHEVGLFQGKLGFNKAIVLLEEGCEEFSNIQGLGQIRFPTGNISACFEEIRRVLEFAEIIKTKNQ